ncbi:hypothetical protein COCCADRAFT_102477 [Bipolaris zeicola 26-R-13]|uniref:Uncharacterized protein n=1 Tax=Cochliobolus carbonum (strain 26-R-13) TaxID=930089 RepID=W6XTQ2_COCC2|nr:uncharacterized protein COCCADRAFT_102477 [Bipolaris zeicola 26-R-13]EUC30992.1 hypothetical protein COCCADRAFT_102477 [Bipolaris zeicola 26-R-13]
MTGSTRSDVLGRSLVRELLLRLCVRTSVTTLGQNRYLSIGLNHDDDMLETWY